MDQKAIGVGIVLLVVGLVVGGVAGYYSQQGTIADLNERVEAAQSARATMEAAFAPLSVSLDAGEVSFSATMKKPVHPAGDDPTTLAAPNALINEQTGGALPASALVAENGVTANLLVSALSALGAKPGRNIAIGEQGMTAEGDDVQVFVVIDGERIDIVDILQDGNPGTPRANYVFLGNDGVQEAMGCGCLLCGRSGPGTVLANNVWTTSDDAYIGPTLYAGLVANGVADGDTVDVVVVVQ